MTTLQDWLNQNYPTLIEKEQVREIGIGYFRAYGLFINDQLLLNEEKINQIDGGQLNLSLFTNLTKIAIFSESLKSPLTQVVVSSCLNLKELWLEENSFSRLDLTKNKKLKKVFCQANNLTELLLPSENEIEELGCGGNSQLPSDFLLNLNPNKLTELGLPRHLETLLDHYLRAGEVIGRNQYGVVIGKWRFNYINLLPRWQREQMKRKWVIKELRNKQLGEQFRLPPEIINRIEEYCFIENKV